MPAPLLTTASVIQCPHGAPVQFTPTHLTVKTDGAPVVCEDDPCIVVGCPFTVPPGKPQPCTTVRWTSTSLTKVDGVRVLSAATLASLVCDSSEPLLLAPGAS